MNELILTFIVIFPIAELVPEGESVHFCFGISESPSLDFSINIRTQSPGKNIQWPVLVKSINRSTKI